MQRFLGTLIASTLFGIFAIASLAQAGNCGSGCFNSNSGEKKPLLKPELPKIRVTLVNSSSYQINGTWAKSIEQYSSFPPRRTAIQIPPLSIPFSNDEQSFQKEKSQDEDATTPLPSPSTSSLITTSSSLTQNSSPRIPVSNFEILHPNLVIEANGRHPIGHLDRYQRLDDGIKIDISLQAIGYQGNFNIGFSLNWISDQTTSEPAPLRNHRRLKSDHSGTLSARSAIEEIISKSPRRTIIQAESRSDSPIIVAVTRDDYTRDRSGHKALHLEAAIEIKNRNEDHETEKTLSTTWSQNASSDDDDL